MPDKPIKAFMGLQSIAIFGASDKPECAGYRIVKCLIQKGFHPLPINPRLAEIDATRCYGNLDELPAPAEGALICLDPEATLEVLKSCAKHKLPVVWLEPGAESREAARLANANDILLITGQSICDLFEAAS